MKCRDNPDVPFFAEGEGQLTKQEKQTAIDLCWQCPVRVECLADALKHENFGVVRGGWFFNSCADVYDGGKKMLKSRLLTANRSTRYRLDRKGVSLVG